MTEKCHFHKCSFYEGKTYDIEGWVAHGVLPVEYGGSTGVRGGALVVPNGDPGRPHYAIVCFILSTSLRPEAPQEVARPYCFDLSHVFVIFCAFYENAIPSITFSMDLAILR